ncbi:chitobiase/beta-hexosaminidase C-terminal domain-containing protein [uncultured Methanobrevibacter sp.]|uniref:chitobiase/beta-hexosaminidase C-terminal domain-containing protein n=1 Tax=uncultured Methanobrevibacter sp. TaxID=253161 RepID=UPI0025DF58A4|nr:chitobiase/beta-hexosaminidase C-terminal domain-containing protein [uncultured Methanobrevibacter sp.]
MNGKRKFLIFILILIALVSMGGVSANIQDNTTCIVDDSVLIDESLYGTTDEQSIMESSDLTTDVNNTLNIDDSDKILGSYNQMDSCDTLVLDDGSVLGDYVVNSPIVNPDFEDGLNGWNNYGASITNFALNSKNGAKFVSLSNNAFISQSFNFDTVDSVSFWYMSNYKDSTINIFIDDVFLDNYTIQKTGLGKKRWEEVKLNLVNYTGYHTLNISQSYGIGYLDYFNFNFNTRIIANFTISSWNISDGFITINFDDLSQGLISNYLWDFGDGNISREQNPIHTFKLDYYTVMLNVSNEYGDDTCNYTLPITLPTNLRSDIGYSTIQDAIDDAVDGDVISITGNYFTDMYFENLVIDKSITLNFNNCTLKDCDINVVNGANAVINNISFSKNNITTDYDASVVIQNSFIHDSNIYLTRGNIILKENKFSNSVLNIVNANVSIVDSNSSLSTVNVVGGNSFIANNIFNGNDVAINQSNGKSLIFNNTFSFNVLGISIEGGLSNISGNIINSNDVGVNVIGGEVNLSFNTFYFNKRFGLIHCIGLVNDNNWWIINDPSVYYGLVEPSDYYDVWYYGDGSVEMKYIVLNISQSSNLDLDYWIGGITYYNVTVDLAHNNLGEDTSNIGSLKPLNLNFSVNGELSQVLLIKNEVFYDILTLGYMSGYLSVLTFDLFNVSYVVPVESDSVEPVITFMTPATTFKDSQVVEIKCDDEDAVIFYTLDGSNPCFSPTRLIYTNPITVNETVTVHATVIDKLGNCPLILMGNIRISGTSNNNRYYNGTIIPYVMVKLSNGCFYTFDGSNPIYYSYGNFGCTNKSFKYNHLITINNTVQLYVLNPDFGFVTYFNPFSIDFYNPDCNVVTYLKEYNYTHSDAIWSQYQGNSNHTGVSNYSGPLTNSSKWFRLDISSSGSVVIDKNAHIYVGADDGYLYCLNNQGNIIWRYGTSSKIICTPTIGNDGNIYFANWMNSTVYCVSPNGQLVWKYNVGGYNTGASPVFGYDDLLYVITSYNGTSKIHVFKNSTFIRSCVLPEISASTPAISVDGSLYMISLNHELVVVNWDGSLRYYKYLVFAIGYYGEDFSNSLSINNDSLFIINPPYFMASCYLDGSIRWYAARHDPAAPLHNLTVNIPISGTPSYYNNILYVAGNYELFAINASTGEILWSSPLATSGYSLSSPLISGDELIYVSKGSVIYAFDLNGVQLWNYTLHGKYGDPVSYSSPVLSNDGTLIVSTNQGIFAFYDIVADFTYSHINGTERGIQFSDLSTEGNNSYLWIFGDNDTSFEQNPVHYYAVDGKYRVVLIVDHNGTMLARNMTIDVVTQDITPPSNVGAFINNSLTFGGVYSTTQIVVLNASDDLGDIVIYYTLDGSSPLNSSTRKIYIVPVEIEANAVLSAVAVDDSLNVGNVSVWSFVISDALNVDELVNSSLIQEIQNLLDEAEAGSKFVFDYPVLYGVNFTINKPLNLVTTTNSKLIGNGVQPVFTFAESAKGSSINGFAIENNGAEGILIKNTSDITIKSSSVNVVNSSGINIVNSDNINVRDTGIYNAVDGILINQSKNTTITRVDVVDAFRNGIWVLKSQNTIISNSFLDDNGKDPYGLVYGGNEVVPASGYGYTLKVNTPSSVNKANHILIDDSKGTYLYNNTINDGYFGVHLYHENHDVVMDGNVFLENVGDAILLSNDYYNVNITHNMIDGSYNGIDFMGYCENVVIMNNLIENLHSHNNDLQSFVMENLIYAMADYVYETHFPSDQFFNHCYNGIQVSYPASNFDEGNTVIIDNVVIKLQHRAWEARKYRYYLNTGCNDYGYNMMDGSDSYHGSTSGATHYNPGKVDMVVDRIGDATYRLRLINRLDNHYLTDIPAFDVTFTTGSYTQTVQFVGSEAIATFDVSTAITTVTAKISAEITKSVSWNIEITEGFNSSNKENDSGYEDGEAINNPDPVIPSISEYIRYHQGSTGGSDVVIPDVPEVTPGTNPGNGTGNGTGSGNGSDGSGSGTGIGNGTGSGVGTGNGTSFNPGNTDGTGNSTVSGNSTEVPTNSTDVPDVSTDPINSTDVPVNSTDIPSDVPSNSTDVPVNSTDIPSDVPSNSTDVPVNDTDVSSDVSSDSSDVPVNSTDSSSDVSDDVSSEVPSDVDSTDVAVNGTEVYTNSTSSDVVDVNVTNVNNTDRLENVADPEDLLNPGDLNVASQTSIESQEATKDSSLQASQESSQPKGGEVGSSGGSAGSDGSKVYEVKKVIDIENTNWQFVVAVILFALIVILGYGYRRSKDDGDEF